MHIRDSSPFSTIRTSIYKRCDSPNLNFVTQCHPQNFLFCFSTTLLTPKVGMHPHVPVPGFNEHVLLLHLFDWVAQQLPSVQTQLRCLKPILFTFQRHVLSMRICASHARNEGRKEIVISIDWLKWCQQVDGSEGRDHRAREGGKRDFVSPDAPTWCGGKCCSELFQAEEMLTLYFSLSKLRFHWSPGY